MTVRAKYPSSDTTTLIADSGTGIARTVRKSHCGGMGEHAGKKVHRTVDEVPSSDLAETDMVSGDTEASVGRGPATNVTSMSPGATIRAARVQMRLSKVALGLLAGLDRRTILRVEAGGSASAETLFSLARALSLPVGRLGEPVVSGEHARVGRLLRDRRRKLDGTLNEMAAAMGVRATTLSLLERGETVPRGGWLARIDEDLAKSLGFRTEEQLHAYLGVAD